MYHANVIVFDSIKCNSNQNWNNDASVKITKKHHMCRKDYIWNLATCSCENGKFVGSITAGSVTTFDEIIKGTNTVSTNFNKKKVTYKI